MKRLNEEFITEFKLVVLDEIDSNLKYEKINNKNSTPNHDEEGQQNNKVTVYQWFPNFSGARTTFLYFGGPRSTK